MSTKKLKKPAPKLDDAGQALVEAIKRELGTATLDGSDRGPATEKLSAARDDAKRIEAALAELKRREEQAWQSAWDAAIAEERLRGYRWFMDYLDLAAAYLRARAEADEAADHLRGLGEIASVANFQTGLWGLSTESLYDVELLGATAGRLPSRAEISRRMGNPPLLTLEECERLRRKAESLAAAEECSEPTRTGEPRRTST